MWAIKCAIVFCAILNFVCGYKVLVFFPFPGKSHTILGEGFVRPLLAAGHNVTYVTSIPMKKSAPNLRQVDVSSNFIKIAEFLDTYLDLKKLMSKEIDMSSEMSLYFSQHMLAEYGVKHENVQKLLMDTNEEFEVVIIEWLYSELYVGVPAVFDCPFIWSSSLEPHPMIMRLIDEIHNPAYSPDHLSPRHPPLTFLQRASEIWNLFYLYCVRWIISLVAVNKTYEEAYGPALAKRGRELPSIDEIKYDGSLMFGNSHVSSGLPLSLPQNYVPIAGYHIKKEVPPLPENLQKIMDNASHGVIFFSLGTMMKGKTLPNELKMGLLKVFSELKEEVVWKLEEQQQNLPKNVHILEWAPQPSILAHPNCVLFITHGGLLSTTEALHYGVPVIGIPLFADQFINTERAVNKGFGRHVPLGYDTADNLKATIEEMLSNPKYRQKVKELSFIYHDRPISPDQELVHWVEHVAKTKGAPHLRSIALQIPWYQKLYLDLLALITIVIYLIVKIVKRFIPKRKNPKKND